MSLRSPHLKESKMSSNHKAVLSTDKAPAALGPYSQAIRCGNLVFLSGQIPLDAASGKVVEGDISAQTEQVIRNMQAVLKAASLDLSNVVKTTVFLKNMDDFGKFNETYGKFFPSPFPARSTVEVARLPKEVRIEIEAVAVITSA